EVDDHVEDGSPSALDELDLGVGRRLIVDATQRAPTRVDRDTALDEARLESARGELARAPDAREEPALVGQRLELDQVGAGERRLGEDHAAAALRPRRAGCRTAPQLPPAAARSLCH